MKKFSDLLQQNKFAEFSLHNFFMCALAEEFLAWYFYSTVGKFLFGKERPSVEKFFAETAEDEYEDHAEWLMKRMDELDMNPGELYDPSLWNKFAVHPYDASIFTGQVDTRTAVIKAINMESEAIETYTAFELYTRDKDVVTNEKIKEILADEQEHLTELKNFFQDLESSKECQYDDL